MPALLAGWLDALDATGRWALLKLLTGALRVGVSARLAKTALAEWSGVELADIEEVWHGLRAALCASCSPGCQGRRRGPTSADAPAFRPLMLSHPIEDKELGGARPDGFLAEWKWDGIRVQAAHQGGETRLFSRTGDDISGAFPDVVGGDPPRAWCSTASCWSCASGEVAPFNDLQQRLNRKTRDASACWNRYPAHMRLYDMLFERGEDLRALPFTERRARLEAWHASACAAAHRSVRRDRLRLDAASSKRSGPAARETGIEGLMLKRRDSPYVAGRPKGHWYKWKRAPLTLDAVLMYAQRGQRQALVLLFRLHVRRLADGENGEASSCRSARPISASPTRSCASSTAGCATTRWTASARCAQVEPELVFEVAFDARASLDAAQIRRRHALPAHPPHPLGQAGGGGRPARDADGDDRGVEAK